MQRYLGWCRLMQVGMWVCSTLRSSGCNCSAVGMLWGGGDRGSHCEGVLHPVCLSAAVIVLFCRQYDIIKDNDSNNNKEKTKPSSEHSTPERPSGGLLRSKVSGEGWQEGWPVASTGAYSLHRSGSLQKWKQPSLCSHPKDLGLLGCSEPWPLGQCVRPMGDCRINTGRGNRI